MPTIEPSKRRYLLTLRGRDDLAAEERHELEMADDVYGTDWWKSGQQIVWENKSRAVGAFHGTHHRWPRRGASDPEEAQLGIWLMNARAYIKGDPGEWAAERGAYLDEVAPGWRGDERDVLWRGAADAVAVFYRTHQRWPSTTATDDAKERQLAQWLNNTRHDSKNRTKGWTQGRDAYLDDVAPGWRGNDRDWLWRDTADAVAVFYRTHQRWPNGRSSDAAEARLGRWLAKARMRNKRGTGRSATQRGEYLDGVAPGWHGPRY